MPNPHFKRIAYTPNQKRSFLPTPSRRPKHRKLKINHWLRTVVATGLMAGVIFFLIGATVFAWFSRNLPDPSNLTKRTAAETTKIYDRTGETLLYEIHGDQKRTPVKLSEIPAYIKNATLVAEDRGFYTHRGFDLTGIIRAALTNLVKGGRGQGGSTITQQLVKNTIVGNEKSYSRKIKELILSYKIEQKFSKDEILEMYLNSIPYGGSSYGVEAAAERYFNKRVNSLTLAESAVLAALPKAPSALSPYGGDRERLIERQRYILSEMKALNYITPEEETAARTQVLVFSPLRDSILAPHFVFYVQSILAEKYGEKYVETGGLKITTTLDLYMQKIAEEEVLNGATKNEEKYGGKNAALIALNPKNGNILSMVGSRDYFDETNDGNVNVTVQPRQPGSSFKPIVYASAFMKGYTPDTILYDVLTTFKNQPQDYTPQNYDGKEHGPVTARQALAGSLNIPAVKMLYLTGINDVLTLAEKMGYTTLKDRSRFGLSLVLGGGEVKLLEHTAAFQSFARDGLYFEPSAILRVEDAEGTVLEENEPQSRQVIPGNVAREITSVLSDNNARSFIFGANNPLTLGDRQVAAKTGTTNDYHDGWTLGYTPSIVVGVWVGNNDNKEMKKGADGSVVAAPIWHNFMARVLGNTPKETFVPSEPTNDGGNPVLYGQTPNETTVIIDRVSGKRATDLTPEEYRIPKTYREAHNILYYVNRSDPRGAPPEHPENDPNYNNWEAGVQAWLKAKGEVGGEIAPTEYDDVHTLENQPILSITNPAPNQTIRGSSLSVNTLGSSARGIILINYYLDRTLVDKDTSVGNHTLNIPAGTTPGFRSLKVEAMDDVGNKKSIERIFNYIP